MQDVIDTRINENPFAGGRTLAGHVNAGTVAIESERAVAEAQGKLVIAKRFPRDEAKAFNKVLEACSRHALAAVAMYSYPRGGQTVSGPSIRMAEELARCWGNLDYGIRELSRRDRESEMEAYCWDMETNVISSQKFTVKHIRDRQQGAKELTDERDIYEITANMGGRRLRARILAILPPDLVDAAVSRCRSTMAGNSDQPLVDRIRRMGEAFAKMQITTDMIEKRLGHKLGDTTPDELADMMGIYQSLKDGMSGISDWFGPGHADAATRTSARSFVQAGASEPAEPEPVTIEPEPEKPKRPRKAAPPPEEAVPDLPPAPPADADEWGF
jgi:hypothetical protein